MSRETAENRDMPSSERFRRGEKSLDWGIADIARRQYGVIARRQLLEMGVGADAIQYRLAIGRLHPLHQGVYSVGHLFVSQQGGWLAAVLASGEGAVLSHHSAAALWGVRYRSPSVIDVTTPRKSRSRAGIRRHCSSIPADEVTLERGIPVTSVPRTIFDLAASEPTGVVQNLIGEAEYRRLYDELSLGDLARRYPGRRGVRRVRLALSRIASEPTGRRLSRLEERFAPFLRRYDLPQPRFNEWIVLGERRFQVDCHWPGTLQIVELDGWEGHGTKSAFRNDRSRDRALSVAGYTVTRLTWSQLDDEPEVIAADLCSLLYKRP